MPTYEFVIRQSVTIRLVRESFDEALEDIEVAIQSPYPPEYSTVGDDILVEIMSDPSNYSKR